MQEYIHTCLHRKKQNKTRCSGAQIQTLHDREATFRATPPNTSDNQIAIASARKMPTETKGTRDHLNQVLQQGTSPGFPNTPEKQDLNIKSLLKMLIEDVKKDIKTLLKKYKRS